MDNGIKINLPGFKNLEGLNATILPENRSSLV
jgi:hypothetical protein